MNRLITIVLFGLFTILFLSGCGASNNSGPDTFSSQDMCVKKFGEKPRICYGMERSDVEEITGKGEKNDFGIQYDFGFTVMYRNEKVAGIYLDEESVEHYETVRGAKIGMLTSELKDLYGEKFLVSSDLEHHFNYYYDSESKKLIGDVSARDTGDPEMMEKVFVFSASSDDSGYIESIMLLDQRMAVYFQ